MKERVNICFKEGWIDEWAMADGKIACLLKKQRQEKILVFVWQQRLPLFSRNELLFVHLLGITEKSITAKPGYVLIRHMLAYLILTCHWTIIPDKNVLCRVPTVLSLRQKNQKELCKYSCNTGKKCNTSLPHLLPNPTWVFFYMFVYVSSYLIHSADPQSGR